MNINKTLILFLLVSVLTVHLMGDQATELLYFIFRTLLRMIVAFLISLAFSLILGIYLAHNSKATRLLLPILYVLQSTPVVAYLPVAFLVLQAYVPFLGSEIAAIFMIFTFMTWAILFNIIEAIRTIPSEIRDAAFLNDVKGINYLRHIVFPAIYPSLISGSISGWGGAWYFLVVGEFITFGNIVHRLPGIGSFIAESAYSGNIIFSLLGISILGIIVLIINKLVWKPLLYKASKYKYEMRETEPESIESNPIVRFIESIAGVFLDFITKVLSSFDRFFNSLGISPSSTFEDEESSLYPLLLFSLLFFVLFYLLFFLAPEYITPEILFLSSIKTVIRIIIAFLIALTWTVLFGVWVARNKKVLNVVMPIADMAQSIPAVALFPLIVVFVINFFGGGIGIEIASILLILTGMQWYLFFNIIRAVRNIPSRILDLSKLLHLTNFQKLKNIYFPAILPAIIAGSIQAIGGGWNAIIISEYIIYQDQIFSTQGLGSLLDVSTGLGDIVGISISILATMIIIIAVDRLIWQKAIKGMEKYRFG